MVGYPRRRGVEVGIGSNMRFVGEGAQYKGRLLNLKYPIERGLVRDWDDMEKVWNHAFEKRLRVEPDKHPVLLTEVVMNPKLSREKMAEIMFETFRVPAMAVVMQATLSLFASSRMTGMVLECGDAVTQVVPIYDLNPIPRAITRINLGGRDVTGRLMSLLAERGHSSFNAAAAGPGREIASDIKEKLARVAPEEDPLNWRSWGFVSQDGSYELPDGEVITVEAADRTGCAEALFQPFLVGSDDPGIHELACDSIAKCDAAMRQELELYGRVVLSGGSTVIPGFADRIRHEINSRAPSSIKIKVVSRPQMYVAWCGGSLVVNLSSMQEKIWISRSQYDDFGPAVVHGRDLF